MKKKIILTILFIIIMIFICYWLYSNTGLKKFEKQNLTFSSHIENSSTPICYITHCEDSIFKSERNFILEFDELKKVKDFTDYYFIEFIK